MSLTLHTSITRKGKLPEHANADFAHENGTTFLLPKRKQVSRCVNTSFIPLANRLRKYDSR